MIAVLARKYLYKMLSRNLSVLIREISTNCVLMRSTKVLMSDKEVLLVAINGTILAADIKVKH